MTILLIAVVFLSFLQEVHGTHRVNLHCNGPCTGAIGGTCTINEDVGQFFIWAWISQFDTLGSMVYIAASVRDVTGSASVNVDYVGFEEVVPVLDVVSSNYCVQIPITIIDDNLVEGTETFTVQGRHWPVTSGGGEGTIANTMTIQITDNDPSELPVVNFQDAVYLVTEGATATVNIVRGNDGGAGNINVDVTTYDLTARSTDDFTLSATPVSVGNAMSAGITVTAVSDMSPEDVEMFVLCIPASAAVPPVYDIGQPSCTTVYVKDPPPLPTVNFQDPVVVVTEGATAALTIERGDDGGASIDVDVTNTLLTARVTDDFTLDMTTVAVTNLMTADITVTGVTETDPVIENVELFVSCITVNALVYNIGQPSCALVFIKDAAAIPTVNFQDPVVVVNEGATGSLTIERGDDGNAGTVNVGVTNTDITARSTDDFTVDMTSVDVANSNTASMTVTGVTDTVVEGPIISGAGAEAFVSCITANVAYNIEQPSCAIVFIKDPAPTPIVAFQHLVYLVEENRDTVIAILRGDDGAAGTIDVGVDITLLTARLTDDFTLSTTTFTIANYATDVITVSGVSDTVIEYVETFFLCITPDAAYDIGQPSCTTVYIKDPPVLPTVVFEEPVYVVDEGSMVTVNIVRGDDGAAGTVDVDFEVILLTARETDDFTLDVQMVAVANFDMEPIIVTAIAEGKVEAEGVEVFLLMIPDDAAYIVGQPSVATIYIKDPPVLPTVRFEEAIYVADEGGNAVAVNVVRGDDGGATPVTVAVDITLLTARYDDDFRLEPQTVDVSNCGVESLLVSTVAEFKVEGQGIEIFLVSIPDDPAYITGKPSIATVYIKDPPILPIVNFEEAVHVVDEGSTVIVNILRGDDGGTVPLDVEVVVTLLTARETDDFTLDVKTVAIDNCGVEPITVSAVAENKVEGQGIEVFLLSIPDNPAYIVNKPSITTVYIKDPPILPTVKFEEAVYVVDEGSTVTVNILREDDGGAVPVDVDVDITLLTARLIDDFSLDVQTVAVDNCGVEPITVSAVAENKVEGQGIEVFLLSIPDDAAYIVAQPSIVTVYIKDPPPIPVVTLDEAAYVVDEGGTVIVNMLRGDDGGTAPVTVDVEVTLLNAANEDFMLDVVTVDVDNCGVAPIIVSGLTDYLKEDMELFLLSIVENDALFHIGLHSAATVYIINVEPPCYTLEYCVYKAVEHQSPFTFNIIRSYAGSVGKIAFSVRDVSTTTPKDILPASRQMVTFPIDSLLQSVNVTLFKDASTEDTEVFEITIYDPTDGDLGEITKATVYLYDPPRTEFYFDRAFYSVLEGTAVVEIVIHRKGNVSEHANVVLQTLDIDAVAPNDYSSVHIDVHFEPNDLVETKRVTIVDDKLIEGTECFELTLIEPSGAYGTEIGSPSVASVAIKDDDYCFSFENRYYRAHESSTEYQIDIVKRGCLGDASTNVTYETHQGTALENIDFAPISGYLNFTNDVSIMHIPGLMIYNDDEHEQENQEQFFMSLNSHDNSHLCQPSTAIVIIENTYTGWCPHDYCVNGGTCVITENNGYLCRCPVGYEGTQCEILAVLCNPECQHNGRCIGPNICLCQSGFVGDLCQYSLCQQGCRNGGVCVDPDLCHCQVGFTGRLCEQVECPEDYCDNGGTCVTANNGYFCRCPVGFDGIRCDKVEEFCQPECENSGICVGYNKCLCQPGYYGDVCEMMACSDHYCLNGGECKIAENSFYCRCTEDYEGERCERSAGLSSGAIGGIAVGALVGLLFIVFAVTFLMMMQRGICVPNSPKIPDNINSYDNYPNMNTLPQIENCGGDISEFMDETLPQYPYRADVEY